jgi:hypothetical protein
VVLGLWKAAGSEQLMGNVFEFDESWWGANMRRMAFYLVLRRRFVSWCLSRIAIGAKIGR